LVDNVIEDEAEKQSLVEKPTCFIIIGRPGVGKSTLAKKLAESWKCILIDTDLLNTHIKNKTEQGLELLNILFAGRSIPEDLILQLILARLNSPDVEHYYVLSCLPFMSDESLKIPEQIELIKNLKLSPDFIINIKCPDKDLVNRLSGLKQHPETGQVYNRDQWTQKEVFNKKKENKDEEEEEEEEDYMINHNPLYLLELDGNMSPGETVMSRLGSMTLKCVSVPVPLHQTDEEELPEHIDTEDLLRLMSSSRTVAPGFRWRRSRWGQTCPVALKEGKVIPGRPELCLFQDKLYILSSQEAYQKFVANPRQYLLPPMPRPPCRVAIIGPPQAGKSTLCQLLAQHYNALVLDLEKLVLPVLEKVEQDRLDQIKDETTQVAIEQIKKKMQQERDIEEADSDSDVRTGWVLDNFPKNYSQINDLQKAEILPDTLICLSDSDGNQLRRFYEKNKESVDEAVRKRLQDKQSQKQKQDELGYPDGPEMNDYKLQLKQFVSEWEKMKSNLDVSYSVLEIGDKSPEDLLQEVVLQIEKRLLGDTDHFCPVALKNQNVLWPCTEETAAKYREKTFYFSSPEARESFLQNPAHFVAQNEPLEPPALRIFLLGARGSGKTTQGEWLAKQLGLFHVQFRELLQMLIMTKTKTRVPYADEVDTMDGSSEDLEALIREETGQEETESEDPSASINDMEQEGELTDEEHAIKAYLSDGHPLPPEILDNVLEPFWKNEPYSTGFILEGFPRNPEEVQYMVQQQLFPDVVVVMAVDVSAVQKRLLPTYLNKWRDRRRRNEAQLVLLRDLRAKNRAEKIAQRRAELMEELGGNDEEDDGEDEAGGNIEDEIKAMLEEEFPLEDDNEDTENEETEEAASERLEIEIEERFLTDENGFITVTELLSEQNIPKVSVGATRKIWIVQHQLLKKIQPLLTNRESLFQKCQPIPYSLAQKLLLTSYKLHSAFGCLDPIKDLIQPLQWPLNTTFPLIFHQFIYFFATKENRSIFMLNPLKYIRQPKPFTLLPVKIAILGPPKSGKTTAQMFAKKYGLARLSIGGVMREVLNTQENTDLAVQMKRYLSQGLVVPDELAIQCLEVALMSSVCSTRYVLDGFPKTLKQAELMRSKSIIPMTAVELELDTVEVLKRGLLDKMKPNPHVMHDSSEILHIRNSCYKEEMEHVRQHFQQQYQNLILLDGSKSQWWIWNNILKETSINMKCIHNFLERIQRQSACINRLCVTPTELQNRLGEFGQYCPVCLALHLHLVDCSEIAALTHAVQYREHYYKMCGEDHLQRFLTSPDQFVTPGCPHTLPQPHLLPQKLTETQVKNRFPQQVEMKGFCPVTYLEGKQYEALVRGKMEFAVEYKERIYIFETKQKQETPETFCDQKLPSKVPPLCEPVPLTSLPTLGYLEQGLGVAVIKAMTAVGCLKPKYPFLSIQRSALQYVAFYLKFNHKSTAYTRQKYKKKLALFEENCELIPYLSSTMRRNYKPLREHPIDFEFKLNRFLA
uniref:Adenylate kinase 9 n=1 Tax=Labrus bergylta TaxID=56723 RepID=A0A3Q3G287_9LABR